MARQLLIEQDGLSVRLKSPLTEDVIADKSNQLLIVRGVPATILNEQNKNERTYPEAVFQEIIRDYKRDNKFSNRSLLGSSDGHPDDNYVEPIRASHVVVDASIKNVGGRSVLFNDWLVLDTDNGRNLRSLVESGITFGTSLRGLGRLSESGVVSDYEFLSTDAVGNPSAGTYAGMFEVNLDYVPKLHGMGESASGRVMIERNSAGDGEVQDMGEDKVSVSRDDLQEVKEAVRSLADENESLRRDREKSSGSDERLAALRSRVGRTRQDEAELRRSRRDEDEDDDIRPRPRFRERRRARVRERRMDERMSSRRLEQLVSKCEDLMQENGQLSGACEQLMDKYEPVKNDHAELAESAERLLRNYEELKSGTERLLDKYEELHSGASRLVEQTERNSSDNSRLSARHRRMRSMGLREKRKLKRLLGDLYEAYEQKDDQVRLARRLGRKTRGDVRLADSVSDSVESRYASGMMLLESMLHAYRQLQADKDERHGFREVVSTYKSKVRQNRLTKSALNRARNTGLRY